MSNSSWGDSRPELTSRSASAGSCSPPLSHQTTLRLVSTSPNPSSRGISPGVPQEGNTGGGSPTSSYNSGDSSTAEDWRRWVRAYSSGSWRGDSAPCPPPAISAVLEAAGERRDLSSPRPRLPSPSPPPSNASLHPSPGEFLIYPESASSRSSNGSIRSTSQEQDDSLDYFKRNRFLKGPKSAYEKERLRTMKRYNLDDSTRRASIDRVCRLAKAHFSTETIIVNLVFEGHTVVAAEAGYDPSGGDPTLDEPVRVLPDLDISLCAHGMLRVAKPGKPREAFVVPDLSKDWRFKHNPQAIEEGGGLAFYASSNINMPTDVEDSSVDVPSTLPVGSICVISDTPRASESDFTAEDRQFLHDCSDMIAREFALGYEQKRREAEQSQSAFLGRFMETTLVQPLDRAVPKSPSSPIAPSTTAVRDGQATHEEQHRAEMDNNVIASSFKLAVEQFLQLTSATSAAILDLRSFRAPLPSAHAARRMGTEWSAAGMRAEGAADVLTRQSSLVVDDAIPEEDETGAGDQESEYSRRQYVSRPGKPSISRSGSSRLYLMGSAGDVDWEDITATADSALAQAVIDALLSYYDLGRTQYGPGGHVSPLAAVLPDPEMPCCIVPVFDAGVPSLLLVLTSSDQLFSFEESDCNFVQNIGSVLASALLRERAFAVDRAKLAFVSQVSHELRTPLHGVTSQLELIREFSSPQQLLKLAPMLDVADLCLESLREVLGDVLEYGKLSNTTAPQEEVQRASLVKGDLATLVEDVIKATWVRGRREALVEMDPSRTSSTSRGKVDMVLEVQERSEGWSCWLDPGGLKRVLLNLLGNSLKFTERGSVKLSLLESKQSHPSGRPLVIIEVEDTGCGMPGEFLREKLFTPFVQANPFASGAGLGMSICATIVKRLGGEIDVASEVGKGTTIRLVLPVEFDPDSCPPSPSPDSAHSGLPTPRQMYSPTTPRQSTGHWGPRLSTRVISDELMALFSPGSRLAQTPFEEAADFDFGRAVDAAQQAMLDDQPKLRRIPSTKRRQKPIVNDLASPSDFADELAKLTLSEAATSPPAVSGFDLRPPPSSAMARRRAPPLPAMPKDVPQPVTMPAPPPFSPKRLPKVHVLFADDNAIARNILSKLFSGKGIDAASATDGQEAVDAYKAAHSARHPFNLALLDVQMPNKDGIEASHEIREYERINGLPRCRIVALTGLDNEVDMQKAGVLSEDGPVDMWIIKGGKSMRVIMSEVQTLQNELDAVAEG